MILRPRRSPSFRRLDRRPRQHCDNPSQAYDRLIIPVISAACGAGCVRRPHGVFCRRDSRDGNDRACDDKAAKPERRANPSRRPQPKSLRAQHRQTGRRSAEAGQRPPSRSTVMRLAAEVDALAAQLEDSRARIFDLEARVDVDPLTETLNRRGFERELKRSLAYVKRYGASAALVYLDLDGFKPVNDRHGHGAGDAMLKAVAATLIRNVRASDVVARFGGDEFVYCCGTSAVPRPRRRHGAGSGRLRHTGAVGQFDACGRRFRRRGASWRARQPRRRAGARRYRDVCAQKRAQGNCRLARPEQKQLTQ